MIHKILLLQVRMALSQTERHMPALHPHTISFLSYLAEHNDKEHFLQAKPLYIEIQEQLQLFTQSLITALAKFDDTIDPKELQPKQCLFRIYRDARFSHNKSPYKTNFGMVI